MIDDNNSPPGMEELESPEENLLAKEEIRPNSMAREWNIRKTQREFNVPRELAEKMIDTAEQENQKPSPIKGLP